MSDWATPQTIWFDHLNCGCHAPFRLWIYSWQPFYCLILRAQLSNIEFWQRCNRYTYVYLQILWINYLAIRRHRHDWLSGISKWLLNWCGIATHIKLTNKLSCRTLFWPTATPPERKLQTIRHTGRDRGKWQMKMENGKNTQRILSY